MQQYSHYSTVVTYLLLFNLIIMLAYIDHRNQMDNSNYKPKIRATSFRRHGPKRWTQPKLILREDLLVYERKNYNKTLLNTCPLAVINHLGPELQQFHTPGYNPKENCTIYKPVTELENGTVKVLSENATCMARCLLPKTDRNFDTGPYIRVPTAEVFECDVIETKCKDGGPMKYYMHLQIHEYVVRTNDVMPLPNVYLLILDSVSTFMAKRSLPKTMDFLKTRMDAIQMEFLNKVGDDSRANGFPLVFGKSIEKINRAGAEAEPPDWNSDEMCQRYLDQYAHYMEEYRKKGYMTMIAEDSSMGILFYPECKGLKRRVADHIYKPFDINLDDKDLDATLEGDTCGESHLHMLEYYEKFINAYSGLPKIAQVWPTKLAHSNMKMLYHADDHFLGFFERNQEKLDNAFLFFLSNHGPLSAGIEKVRLGRYENHNPFLVVVLPKMLRNTVVHKELRKKATQLMTHFDLHATFMDILHFQPESKFMGTAHRSMEPYSKGSSLLREWERLRTCNNLPIPWDYCLCQYKKQSITDEDKKMKLGTFIAQQFNKFLTVTGFIGRCHKQEYKELKTLDAQQLQFGNDMLYSMFVRFTPSNGDFTAEILETPSGFQLISHFSRWGWDETQGNCVPDHARPLCHCK